MKVEELYKEIISNEASKAEFIAAWKDHKVEDFLKAYNCSATLGEVTEFLKAQQNAALSDDILEGVNGGGCSNPVGYSIVTVGVGCIMTAAEDCF